MHHEQGKRQSDGTVHHYEPTYGASPGRFFGYYVQHTFAEEDGVVQSIEVIGSVLEDGSGRFGQDWYRYSVNQVMARYGKPSQVQVTFVPPTERGALPFYHLDLVYEHLGFVISYEGSVIVESAIMRTCLRIEDANLIVVKLQAPGYSKPIFEPQNGYSPRLEEAIGMNVETFYQILRDPAAVECIQTPREIWY